MITNNIIAKKTAKRGGQSSLSTDLSSKKKTVTLLE